MIVTLSSTAHRKASVIRDHAMMTKCAVRSAWTASSVSSRTTAIWSVRRTTSMTMTNVEAMVERVEEETVEARRPAMKEEEEAKAAAEAAAEAEAAQLKEE